jgi:hypothetical protein
MITLAETVAETASAKECSPDEAKAELRGDLAAGRIVAEGVPARWDEFDLEAYITRHQIEPISEAYWLDDQATVYFDQNSMFAGSIGYIHIRIANSKQQPTAIPKPTDHPRKDRGGRPTQYDWDSFWIEIVKIAHNEPDGIPDRADLKARIFEFISDWDEEPSESAIKDKLARLYRALE